MNIKFVKECLKNVVWHENNSYQVEGLLKKSNQYYKFDIRFLNDFNDKKGKLINSQSKADKVLFENDINWILVDTQELIKHMKAYSLKEIKLEELIKSIEWNIILPKK
jgi:superfamily I DNA and/or RNA helicase